MTDYCGSGNNISTPPFISATASPLVMFVMGRDHKLYYEAYNDATDLDGDGVIDIGYKHEIDYYGYFDSYKCYTYTTSGTARFNPSRTTADKYCGGTGEWSGNFLNWLTMSRIDVLRKVLYGGHRSTDGANETVLASTYIPRDAHSWGKEYWGTDTRDLTPYDAPSNFSCDMPDAPANWNVNGKILFVTYEDGTDKGCGTNHSNMLSTFSVQDYKTHKYVESVSYNDSAQTNQVERGNLMFVTKFVVPAGQGGTWTFSIDSDDGGELEINNTIVASYYGCHGYSGNDNNNGSISLTAGNEYTLIVRVREQTGGDGARVRYRRPGDASYKTFSKANLDADSIVFYAPDIVGTQGVCSLKTTDFVNTGEPFYGDDVNVVSKRHLFCMTSDAVNEDHLIKVARNQTKRKWEWASTERPVCSDSVVSPNEKRYVRVKVCDSSAGEETNCYNYGSGSKKPTGLLQRYGTGNGENICSKTNETDTSCTSSEGFLVKSSPMYFGMITGSYEKNLSGGVLRKNITSISEEINADGTFVTTTPTRGGIIKTLSTLKINDYDYGSDSYNSNCGWITDGPVEEGECKAWGNPIGEMYWETLRYLSGAGSATNAYTYSSSTDGGLSLPKPSWMDPYANFPSCSKPNIIVVSDVNPSYDDGVPASGTFTDYNRSDLLEDISENEGLSGSYFIGNNGTLNDFMCSAKSLSTLGSALGLCPEEPTKKGTYNTAALASYAKTQFSSNTHSVVGYLKNIDTHAVALASPLPEIVISVNGSEVKLVPLGKSVGGSGISCGYTINNGTYGLILNGTGFCPSNGIVDFYAETITETSGRFRINFEDVEQGADHDMDAIARYDYVVNANGTVTISLNSEYAAGGINQAMGFIITGTTADGVYLPISDLADGSGSAAISGLPLSWSKTFSPGGTNASLLKDPLWYAAKYGGFKDKDDDGVLSSDSEWDEDGDGVPDSYHFITNPLLLEQKFAQVFTDIIKKTASGTAPAIGLGKNKGTLINHALFYPEKDFGDSTQTNKIQWAGQLFTYWFFTHKMTQNIMEDSNGNLRLDLCSSGDKILEFRVDDSGSLQIDRYTGNCQGSKDTDAPSNTDISIDDVAYLWEGGDKLSQTSAASRVVYTNVNGSLVPFNIANKAGFQDMLGASASFPACIGTADNLISYILGTDYNGCRSRMLLDGSVYKLGDILNSSPVMVDYPNKTGKPGFTMTYVGANDGMLHAFRAGKVLTTGLSSYQAVRLCNDSMDCGTDKVGREEWAFIPKNALPYLRYLADPDYCHIYYNDLTPYILELDDNNDGYVEKRILIGGMRLGGSCASTATGSVRPPADTCADASSSSCVGLSSYYALDITDQSNPVLLWEFTDPYLAFSFSGPAFIKKGSSRYIMFISGPTNYAGLAGQDLNIFVLNLNPSTYGISSVHKFTGANRTGYTKVSALSSYSQAFGGKLFTNGVDYGGDGDTDVVFFGINQMTGNASSPNWSGNVMGVKIASQNPADWEFGNVFNSAQKPVTQKVEYMKCFDMKYIYFGTGRWFYKTDEAGVNANDHNYLYGVRIDDCDGGNCNLNNAHSSADACSQLLSGNGSFSWYKELEAKSGSFLMERLLSDPEPISYANVIFFGTTEPNSDICSFGGRSRVWGLNCASGSAIALSCDGQYAIDPDDVPPVWVPRTPGDITKIPSPETETTDWKEGAIIGDIQSAAEQGRERKGRLLFWIEK
ncbi:MAG: hypothetical protein AB7E48_04975 [Deferribacterales bacterium]